MLLGKCMFVLSPSSRVCVHAYTSGHCMETKTCVFGHCALLTNVTHSLPHFSFYQSIIVIMFAWTLSHNLFSFLIPFFCTRVPVLFFWLRKIMMFLFDIWGRMSHFKTTTACSSVYCMKSTEESLFLSGMHFLKE